ncbi:hypothetical protein [Lewinella sp. 4G2]|uniref:hypothetical protein n=1 Tax=Lewinella sp. 4G2 TaxID=1803372 RepID=UPI0007B46D4D|nr:hypothetical protein [Lewinella sp. 4G2]OAV43919.1 hypothetical protein A3850_005165 [Lewinella sp. 4G2]
MTFDQDSVILESPADGVGTLGYTDDEGTLVLTNSDGFKMMQMDYYLEADTATLFSRGDTMKFLITTASGE